VIFPRDRGAVTAAAVWKVSEGPAGAICKAQDRDGEYSDPEDR
jgi:hypothetical protein